MRKVGLKILKNRLSENTVGAAGETIVVTDRGRAVAEIVPLQPRNGHESFIERGVREGWLTPAKKPFQPLPPRRPIPGTGWSNCWPISTAIGKIAGDLRRQFGPARRLACRTPVAARGAVGRGSRFQQIA